MNKLTVTQAEPIVPATEPKDSSMSHHPSLFTPAPLGRHTLKNRIVLPPLTRQRSTQPGDVANDLMASYYRQRASAG